MQNYRSFDFLNKLYFVRTGGSPEEYSAAMLIKQECERLGAQAELEAFPVDGCKIAKAVLKNADTDKEYECCGVGMSGSTPVGGITAPFTYVTSVEDAEIQNLEGKICLVHTKLMKTKLYKKLVEKHASAVVLCCGDVYSQRRRRPGRIHVPCTPLRPWQNSRSVHQNERCRKIVERKTFASAC